VIGNFFSRETEIFMIFVGYFAAWFSGFCMTFRVFFDGRHNFTRTIISKFFGLCYFFVNFFILMVVPNPWIKVSSLITIIFYFFILGNIFNVFVASVFNTLFGIFIFFYSIMSDFQNVPVLITGPMEIVSLLAFLAAVVITEARKEMAGFISFNLLIISSFSTPLSKGYLPLLAHFVPLYILIGRILDARRFKPEGETTEVPTMQKLILKQFITLYGCLLVFLSAYFRNIVMYWEGIGIIAFGFFRAIKRRNTEQMIMTIVTAIAVMIFGYFVQSKVVVFLGIGSVFIVINTLALSKFSGSILFPFVITALGMAFIYAGTFYENVGEVFEVLKSAPMGNQTSTINVPYVVPPILDVLNSLSYYLVKYYQN